MAGPTTSLDAEEALVERLRAGDSTAYAEVLETEGPKLLAVARRIVGSDSDAEDALQDGLISAFRNIGGFQGDSRFTTWLHRVVINAALMKLRRRRRRQEVPIDDLLPAFADNGHVSRAPAPWTSPEATLEREELRSVLRNHIQQLPGDYRDVIILRDIEQLDTQHTAEVLGIAPGAVKTRLHRARQALRELLAGTGAEQS